MWKELANRYGAHHFSRKPLSRTQYPCRIRHLPHIYNTCAIAAAQMFRNSWKLLMWQVKATTDVSKVQCLLWGTSWKFNYCLASSSIVKHSLWENTLVGRGLLDRKIHCQLLIAYLSQ
jgi:hypothetical protein